MIANKSENKAALPSARRDLGYANTFSAAEAGRLMTGHKPESMDDKWFIYSEDDWVYFVRSWTGFHIYGIQLENRGPGGWVAVASWVNAESEQYTSPSQSFDIEIVDDILRNAFGIHGGGSDGCQLKPAKEALEAESRLRGT